MTVETPPLEAPFPFSQPFDGIVKIDQLYTNFWQWLAISGEPYPPTLTSAAYGSQLGSPCYSITALNGHVDFPILPRVGPAQSTVGVLTFTFSIYTAGTTSGQARVLLFNGSDTAFFVDSRGFGYRNSGGAQVEFYDVPPAANTWHTYTATFDPVASTMDVTVDGARPTFANSTGTVLPVAVASTNALAPAVKFSNASVHTTEQFSKLRVAWS